MPALRRRKKEGKTTFTVDLGFGVVVVRDVRQQSARSAAQTGSKMPFL